jgi:NADPH:quinone reductase-like Zn-dependent oxidoreductase
MAMWLARLKSPVPAWIRRALTITANAGDPGSCGQVQDDEVLVRVHATTVTSGDCRIRSFTVPPLFWLAGRIALGLRRPKRPILGSEFAGEIAAVGKDVRRFKAGDRVFGSSHPNFGTYAEYCCLPEDGVMARTPADLTDEHAAAIPFGG